MRHRWIFVLFAFALLAMACAGPGGEAPADTEAAPACEPGQVDGDLALFNWTDYMDPELIDQFQEEYGVTVTQDFYPSNEELLARLQAGATGYDVMVPSDYMVEVMRGQDLLMELDKGAIPNAANIDALFADPPYDPGNTYSLPYQWGTTGIGVNFDETGEDIPPTWGVIFDPEMAQQWSGQISLLDDAREVMGAVLKYLGYSLNTTNEDEIREAGEVLDAATQHVATFDSLDFDGLLVRGETVLSHGWSGTVAAAIFEAEDMNLGYIIPEEGGVVWVDTIAIPADAPHPCTAHTFIDFILDAENGAALTNWTYYASPNAAAEPMILEEILEDPSIYPPDDVMERLEFIEDVGDLTPLYEQIFTEARS